MVKEKTIIFVCLCFCHLVGVFAGTDELKSVMEGDSVSLNSNLTEIQSGDRIKWKFGPNRSLIAIARTDGVNNMIYDVPNGIFRDRLKLDNKTGSLTIMDITTDHAGVYDAEISGSSSSSTHRFNVTVYAAPTVPTSSASTSASTSASASLHPLGSPNPTALISAAAAAGFLLLILAVAIFFIFKPILSCSGRSGYRGSRERSTSNSFSAPCLCGVFPA